MNKLSLTMLAATVAGGSALAQNPNFLLTFSQVEGNVSGSGGTALGTLLPNEIAKVDFLPPCAVSAEKWLPRTCANTMAGDDDANGVYFNPGIFGSVDALLTTGNYVSPIGGDTQRSIYWSPSAALGTAISGAPGLRPGDVGRIDRIGFADGQVVHFITQELVNNALGLPPTYPIDIDAAAFQPNFGFYFSVDVDVTAMTVCGPTLIRDGDVLCLPGGAMSYTSDLRVAATAANSAVVVYSEAQMNVFTANAQVTDRFGACVTTVGDIESLEMDLSGPVATIVPCPGFPLSVPNLIYSCENGTGGSLLEIAGGGTIHNNLCGPVGTSCGVGGPTFGPQIGIRPVSTTTGAASYVNALCATRVCTHVLEPQQHVLAAGTPAHTVDYNNPFVLSLILIEIVPPVVAPSFPAAPFSPTCFPDLYAPTIYPWTTVPAGFGSFAGPPLPPVWTGKILYQGVGFGVGVFELSTPSIVDVM